MSDRKHRYLEEERKLELMFSDIPKPGTVYVPKLIETLSRVQDSLYVIGSYLLDEPYKEAGRRSKPLVTHCTLLMSGLSSGSTVAELEVAECAPSILEGEAPLGIRCLEIMDTVIESVINKEDPTEAVSKSIKDSRYRTRVAQELLRLWPDMDSPRLQIRIGKAPRRDLSYPYRPRVERLIGGPEVAKERSVVGPILKVNLIRKDPRSLTIWTPDGLVEAYFDPELIESVRRNFGAVVEIKGKAELDDTGSIKSFKSVRFIDAKKELEVSRLESDDATVELKTPLRMSVDFDLVNRVWTLENDALGIVSAGKNWSEAFDQFQEEFFFLRDNYLRAPDSDLTSSAVRLKRQLKSIME